MSVKSVTMPVSVRVTEYEKEQIDEIISKRGYTNTADFIRVAIREKIKQEM